MRCRYSPASCAPLSFTPQVPTVDGQTLAEEQSLLFMETSALEGEKVEEAFNVILTEIYSRVKSRVNIVSSKNDASPSDMFDNARPLEIAKPPTGRPGKSKKGCCK